MTQWTTPLFALLLLAGCARNPEPGAAEAPGAFAPSWESLAQNDREPEWYQDAKLGI